MLSRGTIEEKLRWTFSLYDLNGDGYITKEEMTEIVTAIYDLMGKIVEPMIDDDAIREKVERLFQVSFSHITSMTLNTCCLRYPNGKTRNVSVIGYVAEGGLPTCQRLLII